MSDAQAPERQLNFNKEDPPRTPHPPPQVSPMANESATSSSATITLPKWDSRQEPNGWPVLKGKIIEQFIDCVPDIDVFEAMTFTLSDDEKNAHPKQMKLVERKVYKALSLCLTEGTDAHDLMQKSKLHTDPDLRINPGQGLKLVQLLDTTFGTSVNQTKMAQRTTPAILDDILNLKQGEALPAVYYATLCALLAELPVADRPTASLECAFFHRGLNPQYETARRGYLKGEYSTLAQFYKDGVQKDHDLLMEMGAIDLNPRRSTHTALYGGDKAKIVCHWCGTPGHKERDCKKKKDGMSKEDATAIMNKRRKQKAERKARASDSAKLATPTVTFSAFIGEAEEPQVLDEAYAAPTNMPAPRDLSEINIPKVHSVLRDMRRHIMANRDSFHFAVCDSGTNLNLIDEQHDFVKTLKQIRPATGQVKGIGDHACKYTGVGKTGRHQYTMASLLKCFLYSTIQHGFQGVTTVNDWHSETKENMGFIYDKTSGVSYPLIQFSEKGLLHVPYPKSIAAATAFFSEIDTARPERVPARQEPEPAPATNVVTEPPCPRPNAAAPEDVEPEDVKQGVAIPGGTRTYAEAAAVSDDAIPATAFKGKLQRVHSVDDVWDNNFLQGLADALAEARVLLASDDRALVISDIMPKLGKKAQHYLTHCRLSHLSSAGIKQLEDAGVKGVVYHPGALDCDPCREATMKRDAVPKREPATPRNRDAKFGTDVHIDVVYATVKDIHNNLYQLTVVDEKTTFPVVALSKTRGPLTDALIEICKAFKAKSKNKFNSFTIDRGGELLNNKFTAYCKSETGQEPRVSCTGKPWQNGLAERMQAVLWDAARADLKMADLPYSFWGPAVTNAAVVLAHRPSTRLGGISPKHFITGKPADVSRFRVFGCPVTVLIPPRHRDNKKLGNRSVSGIHIGQSSISKAWRIYVPKTKANSFATRREYHVDPTDNMIKSTEKFGIVDTDDVIFNELFSDLRGRQMTIYPKGQKIIFEKTSAVEFQKPMAKPSRQSSKSSQQTGPVPPKQTPTASEPQPERYVHADGIVQPKTVTWLEPDDNIYDVLAAPQPPAAAPVQQQQHIAATPAPLQRQHQTTPGASAPAPAASTPTQVTAAPALQPTAAPIIEPARPPTPPPSRSSRRSTAGRRAPKYDASASNKELNEATQQYLASLADAETPPEAHVDAAFFAFGFPEPIIHAVAEGVSYITNTINPDHIHKLAPERRQRCEDAIELERTTMLEKCVTEVPITDVPKGTKIHKSLLTLVEKEDELPDGTRTAGRTRARCCFYGAPHAFDHSSIADVFAPCVRWISMLIMACFIAMMGLYFTGIDYSAAYLNATLPKPVFMWPPKPMRRIDKNGNLLIYRVHGALYGHPQSGACWNKLLVASIAKLGFQQFKTDPCVFSKWIDNKFCIILLQTDDVLLTSNDNAFLKQCKAELLALFDGRDLGDVTVFNGVSFRRRNDGLSLHLKNYWKRVIDFANIGSISSPPTPISKKISTADCPPEVLPSIRKIYWRLAGFLVYGVTRVRLDLIYATSAFTRVMSNPAELHLNQLKKGYAYIRSTMNAELNFHYAPNVQLGMDFVFDVWPDSSHADDDVTMRSTGGWFIFLQPGQAAISAKSGLRKTVTTSSTESEYCTYSDSAKEAMFCVQFIEELNFFKSVKFNVNADSQPACQALKKCVTQSRFKHIRIHYHYLRELLSEGICWITKVSTSLQIGDLATKPLSESLVKKFRGSVLGEK